MDDRPSGGRRVCLLTGAAGRLGTVFRHVYAADYQFAAVYRKHPLAKEDEHQSLALQADLTVDADRRRVVETTLANFGRIDVLVNSAVHSVWGPMLDGDRLIGSAPSQFLINVVVPLQLAVLCARSFWGARKLENVEHNRNIVNVSSIAGSKVYPKLGQGVYAASKSALDHLSRHMADEFSAIGIRVNSLAPNAFPRIIPTQGVARSLKKLDVGTMTGRVLVVDREGETFL